MKTTAKIVDICIDLMSRKPKITLLLDSNELDNLEILQTENKVDMELKKHIKKRSLDANSYYWVLLQQYATEKNVDTIQEYKERVKRLGIFKQFKLMPEQVQTFEKVWSDRGIAWFCEILDTTYIGEIEFKIVNAYYGSSSFNSKQMSRLINDLVEDCKEAGIETKTKEELESLLGKWR